MFPLRNNGVYSRGNPGLAWIIVDGAGVFRGAGATVVDLGDTMDNLGHAAAKNPANGVLRLEAGYAWSRSWYRHLTGDGSETGELVGVRIHQYRRRRWWRSGSRSLE